MALANKNSTHIARTLLHRAYSPSTTETLFTDKVLRKPLHLRPTSPDPASKSVRSARRLQRLNKKSHKLRRQKPKPLSAREKRISGIYDIPESAQKYEIYVPLRRMWIGYMWEILGLEKSEKSYVTAQGVGSKLASADFHGAELQVVRSRCVGRVGTRGIVVRDTKFTFVVVTMKNELRTIPKAHTVFRFEIPQPESETDKVHIESEVTQEGQTAKPFVFEIHGSQFENRATDRATKKFKQRNMNDL